MLYNATDFYFGYVKNFLHADSKPFLHVVKERFLAKMCAAHMKSLNIIRCVSTMSVNTFLAITTVKGQNILVSSGKKF